jgi:hypothetical protein
MFMQQSPQAILYAAPDAPYAEMNILPNPNDGNFEIEYVTNARKQYTMILGPYGLVYSRYHTGTVTIPVHLLSMNPPGAYHVITRWYFDDDCMGTVITRQGFVLLC